MERGKKDLTGSFFRELAIIAQKCGPKYAIHASSFRGGGKMREKCRK